MSEVRILQGDCRTVLKTLPDESVHCCVTSPPYFGLRDYGTASWEGGQEGCEHVGTVSRTAPPGTDKQASNAGASHVRSGNCACGARRIDSQIGLEQTPDAYVAELVAVFREVRRVLRSDGTLWLNLGDSYAGGGNYRGINSEETLSDKQRSNRGARGVSQLLGAKDTPGCKPKDLLGIPWMVAFALRADGWYLRSDIIWHKPNPMPESVTDRPTKSHEYLFLLSKSAKYHYDADAIAEPSLWADDIRNGSGRLTYDGKRQGSNGEGQEAFVSIKDSRNKRTVWTVPTAPYSEAHFATFPPDLIKPCILAGCPVGGTVLDPFGGSGTTGMVAREIGRNAILIELNPDYVPLIEQRINITPGLAL